MELPREQFARDLQSVLQYLTAIEQMRVPCPRWAGYVSETPQCMPA